MGVTAPYRVLILDDDEALRELLCTLLEGEGYDTRALGDGRAGLLQASEWQPHLILLDLMMPKLDGWSFLSEYRRDGLNASQVVVLSGTDVSNEQLETLNAVVLPKPFDLDELLTLVARLVGNGCRER